MSEKGFRGWSATALEFYEGLEADNTRSYWTDNREVYEREVRAPMEALLRELAGEFGEARLFRPYRDVRFSRDKTPYKTSIAAMIGSAGYVQLSAEGLMAGAGMYHLARDQLERYRAAVAAEATGSALAGVVIALERAKVEVHGTDPLKTAPRGYPKDHPRVDLLRNRGLVGMRQWPVAPWLGTAAPVKKVAQLLRTTLPLTRWLGEHVGGSTLATHR